ncbi:FecR family protein [Parabacteroides pacaensis]|uniref:FecR family protein n=1 Tax=Parabacteroides pacaensis TaxID=2086575 RepID=UPI000D101CE3|nr:FecR domain-containing protein [Parabacteroides pacaensis]
MNRETLCKYIAGEATPEEKETVVRWIEAEEKNKEEFLLLRKLYTFSAWQPDVVSVVTDKQSGNKRRMYAMIRDLLKIAAIFLIAFSLGIFYMSRSGNTVPEQIMQTVYVPAGQRVKLVLADSTQVWLNAKTTFTFPSNFAADSRKVILDGEGYFEVTRHQEQPFIVKTSRYDIEVLGTEFNVSAYQGHSTFETALLKGSVQIESPTRQEKILLKPREKVSDQDGRLVTSTITQYDYFLWKEGLICFDDITISELFEKLQLYFDVKLVVRNTSILNQRYTGKFRTADGVEQILKTLQLRTKFKYEKNEEKENLIIIN